MGSGSVFGADFRFAGAALPAFAFGRSAALAPLVEPRLRSAIACFSLAALPSAPIIA